MVGHQRLLALADLRLNVRVQLIDASPPWASPDLVRASSYQSSKEGGSQHAQLSGGLGLQDLAEGLDRQVNLADQQLLHILNRTLLRANQFRRLSDLAEHLKQHLW